jgi:hypothetical protein
MTFGLVNGSYFTAIFKQDKQKKKKERKGFVLVVLYPRTQRENVRVT